MRKPVRLALMLIAGMALLPACNRKMESAAVKSDGSVASAPARPAPANPPQANVIPPIGHPEQVPRPVAMGMPVQFRDIFFDFDKSQIRNDGREILQEDGQLLRNHPDMKIKIEGHCDERGTVEYNLALGNRRAEAVKHYLMNLGVDAARISVVSYGKEKPFCSEQNEACYKKNRRGHFVTIDLGS